MDETKKIEKFAFMMRVTNNIHNVAALDDSELVQKWTEEEKIPVKASPVTPVPKPTEEKKEGAEGDKPAEEPKPTPEPVKQPEQTFETKIKNKEMTSKIKFTTSNFALAPALRKQFKDAEDAMMKGD